MRLAMAASPTNATAWVCSPKKGGTPIKYVVSENELKSGGNTFQIGQTQHSCHQTQSSRADHQTPWSGN